MTVSDDPLAEDPQRRGLIAACSLQPSTLLVACMPSELHRLRSRIPSSSAEFLAIQRRLAELGER